MEGGAVNVGTFIARPTDKWLSDIQAQLLVTYYLDCNDVKKALSHAKDERGKGLGTTDMPSGSWTVNV